MENFNGQDAEGPLGPRTRMPTPNAALGALVFFSVILFLDASFHTDRKEEEKKPSPARTEESRDAGIASATSGAKGHFPGPRGRIPENRRLAPIPRQR